MPTPLYDAVRRYIETNPVRAHTPGHSGAAAPLACLKDVLKWDVTEARTLDSLYHPDGPIAQAEALASDYFGTAATLFCAGGNTLALQTMLALALRRGQTLLCGRNVHAGVINACALLQVQLAFVSPAPSDQFRIRPADLRRALQKHRPAAVLVTSPNYYGAVSDIAAIAALCREHGIPLLVDNAHGTHLRLFGRHPISLGASMSADSAHKTLPVLTGGAFLQLNDPAYTAAAKQKMALFGSTSPSYPILLSLDLARAYCAGQDAAAAYQQTARQVSLLKQAAHTRGIPTVDGDCDPMRLTLDTGCNGRQTADLLWQHGVSCELWDDRYVVLLFTPFHTPAQIDAVYKALQHCPPAGTPAETPVWDNTTVLPLWEALNRDTQTVSPGQSAGRIAAQTVFYCPPGIPAVLPGERISQNTARFLKNSSISGVLVVK